MSEMRSPLSGENITRPRSMNAAPPVDLAPLLARCEALERRLAETEARERSTVAELTQYAMKAMEAAMKACAVQTAPQAPIQIPPDPRIQEITESVTALKSKIDAISTVINRPMPTPTVPKIDMDAIVSAVRSEVAVSAAALGQTWNEVTVVIGARDANGNIKEFVVKPKGDKK